MFHVIKINVAGQGSRKGDGIRNSFNVKKHLSPASRPPSGNAGTSPDPQLTSFLIDFCGAVF